MRQGCAAAVPGLTSSSLPDPPAKAAPRQAKLEAARSSVVGDNVWLGGGAIVCPGVDIGAIVCPGVDIGENTMVDADAASDNFVETRATKEYGSSWIRTVPDLGKRHPAGSQSRFLLGKFSEAGQHSANHPLW